MQREIENKEIKQKIIEDFIRRFHNEKIVGDRVCGEFLFFTDISTFICESIDNILSEERNKTVEMVIKHLEAKEYMRDMYTVRKYLQELIK